MYVANPAASLQQELPQETYRLALTTTLQNKNPDRITV
jgi:hypothetical protein